MRKEWRDQIKTEERRFEEDAKWSEDSTVEMDADTRVAMGLTWDGSTEEVEDDTILDILLDDAEDDVLKGENSQNYQGVTMEGKTMVDAAGDTH